MVITIEEVVNPSQQAEKRYSFSPERTGHLELFPDWYTILWPTDINCEEAIRNFRDFMKSVEEGGYRKSGRRPQCYVHTGEYHDDEIGKWPPLSEFEDPNKFKEYLRGRTPLAIFVHTPHVTLEYHPGETSKESDDAAYRTILLASHVDLSERLPEIMRITYRGNPSGEAIEELAGRLGNVLRRYGK